MNNTYSPIRENAQEGTEAYFHEQPSSIWCGCFRFPCFQQQTKEGEANSLLQENRDDSSWMVKKMKELKEYSELVAGPKWKNLVRKIGKYCNPKKSSAKTQFQYDSDSYALNFDDAGEDDDGLLRNFSSRFAAPFSGSVANNNNNNLNRNANNL
ncbi:hypothetical protein HAX54_013118 [Datura stramonium]|uniref:Uncharacterized protein n=1 Tax=Datura stramonium TaxID=4076 RepID=A0ABS8Y4A1_DATST|nr:hypothetical protein [Datura stramonium]